MLRDYAATDGAVPPVSGERETSVPHDTRESGRGLPHSKTWRTFVASRNTRQRLGVRQSSAAFTLAIKAVDWSLLDRVRMKFELESLLNCQVDLLNRRALEKTGSRLRAAAILAQAQPLYAES